MVTSEQQMWNSLFLSEADGIFTGVRNLAQDKKYEIEAPEGGWLTGNGTTLRKGTRWLKLASRTPQQLGSIPELTGARGFKITTSQGHEALLYCDLNGWHVSTPAIVATGKVHADVADAPGWLRAQLIEILD